MSKYMGGTIDGEYQDSYYESGANISSGSVKLHRSGSTVTGSFCDDSGCTTLGSYSGFDDEVKIELNFNGTDRSGSMFYVYIDEITYEGEDLGEEISVSPGKLIFSNTSVGSTSEPKSVTVKSTGFSDLTTGAVEIDNSDDFLIENDECTNVTLASGDTCTIEVVFAPLSEGEKTGDLDISYRNNYIESVTLSGTASSRTVLTIEKDVAGTGKVTSTDKGISCGEDCSEEYDEGTKVTLEAIPDSDSSFTGWSIEECGDFTRCVVTMDEDVTVTATFDVAVNPDIKVNGEDESVSLSPDNNVVVTLSLELSDDYTNKRGELWIYAHSPFGQYTYSLDGGRWSKGGGTSLSGTLPVLDEMEILDRTLPPGDYTFWFTVDMSPNNSYDHDFADSVEVKVE